MSGRADAAAVRRAHAEPETERGETSPAVWSLGLGAALASSTDAREALAALCEEICRLLPCDRAQIWRGDLRQMAMHTVIAAGFPPEHAALLPALVVPMEDLRLVREGFVETKVALVERTDELDPGEARLMQPFGIGSAIFLLLERGTRVLGALQLSWCAPERAFAPDPAIVDLIRMHAGIGVDFLARTTDALELSQNLSDTATLLARIHDPDELLQAMAAKVAQAIGTDWSAVHLYDEASHRMRCVAIHGSRIPARDVPARPELIAWVEREFARSDEGVLEISDVAALAEHIPSARDVRLASCVSVPLRDAGTLLGILTVGYRERRGAFARRQISLLKGLAQHAQVALVNAQLVRSLEEANRVKSDFVAAVSHDLRTPLHVLIGYNSMLLEDACGPLNEEQRAMVERMYECSVHFLDLINGVLGVGRVEAGFDRVVRTRVALPQLADDIRREVEYLRRPEVELRVHADPAVVASDAAKLTTILRNLVTNALKFTVEGHVEMTLRMRDDELVLRVSDTGPGIAPEERPKVFEMFRQGAAGLRAGGSGLGLGLYLVQRLSRMLGGEVTLESGEAGTTVFEVRLPLESPGAPA